VPLFDLLSVPTDGKSWEIWAFSNRDQCDNIRQAILKQKNINLTQYQLYPIDFSTPETIQNFLANNSQAHDDFNSVLNLQSTDIEDVDFKDKKQLEAWINLVYQELYVASAALAI
jgi:hypothetical protein